VYLVALTGYGAAEDVKSAYEAGFDAHLTKPAEPDRIDDLIRQRRS
jgi:CheY-like chemotaxis protein